MKTAIASTRLKPSEVKALDRFAKRQGLNRAALIAEVLRIALKTMRQRT